MSDRPSEPGLQESRSKEPSREDALSESCGERRPDQARSVHRLRRLPSGPGWCDDSDPGEPCDDI